MILSTKRTSAASRPLDHAPDRSRPALFALISPPRPQLTCSFSLVSRAKTQPGSPFLPAPTRSGAAELLFLAYFFPAIAPELQIQA